MENNREPLPLDHFQRMDFINYIEQLQGELKANEEKLRYVAQAYRERVTDSYNLGLSIQKLKAKIEDQNVIIARLSTASNRRVISLLLELSKELQGFSEDEEEDDGA